MFQSEYVRLFFCFIVIQVYTLEIEAHCAYVALPELQEYNF